MSQPADLLLRPTAPAAARATVRRWLSLALAVLLGVVGGAVAFLAAALVTSSVIGLSVAALVVCFGVSSGVASRAAHRDLPGRRTRIAFGVGAGTTLLATLLATLTVFRPLAPPAEPAPLPPQAGYWELPTGSRIAYLRVPAEGPASTPPIIRLHGGPGAYAVANQRGVEYFGQLAQDGYDVYFYDQIGSGLSARLDDLQDYTVTRHVEDLEAIRQTIGAAQVILLAESWGATVAASYLAAYPERVARAIFSSPAPINPAEWGRYQEDVTLRLSLERRQQVKRLSSQPRLIALMLLTAINPRAARAFAPDREMDGWMDSLVTVEMPALVCDPAGFPQGPPVRGFGFWAGRMVGREFFAQRGAMDPRARLASSPTPVLILRGECDHIKWEVADQYRMTFSRSALLYFPGAGHVIYYDQPALYLAAVRAFLLDQPLPLRPYAGAVPPR